MTIRFEQLGRFEDLEEAITCNRQALVLFPHGHPHRSLSLNNLANAVSTRFEQLGRMEDLEEAIVKHLLSDPTDIPILSITLPIPYGLPFSSWEERRIWRRRSHVTVKHLLSNLTDIPIVHLFSTMLAFLCPLALSS